MNDYIKESVRSLSAYVPGEQPSGGSVIKLNTNENPYPPSPRVAEALFRAGTETLRLYPDPTSRGVREMVAQVHGCEPEQVFVGNGSDEILALCIRAFVERGKGSVGYFDPSYSLYPVLCAIEETEIQPVELGPYFEWAMPDKYAASLFFITSPNAPTGIQYPKSAVKKFCKTFPGVVVIDEAYVDFAREDAMDLALSSDRVIVTRTLSKSYSLAGLRLGYAVGPRPLIEALHKIKDVYNVDRLAQEIACVALADQDYMRGIADRIRALREDVAEQLRGRGFSVFPSEANFLWVKPPGIGAQALFDALRSGGIHVRHFAGSRTGDYLRITIGSDVEMDLLLQAIDQICRRHRGSGDASTSPA